MLFLPKNERKPRILVKTNSFVCFLEEFMAWQFAFEINWPLVTGSIQLASLVKHFLNNYLIRTSLWWCSIGFLSTTFADQNARQFEFVLKSVFLCCWKRALGWPIQPAEKLRHSLLISYFSVLFLIGRKHSALVVTEPHIQYYEPPKNPFFKDPKYNIGWTEFGK